MNLCPTLYLFIFDIIESRHFLTNIYKTFISLYPCHRKQDLCCQLSPRHIPSGQAFLLFSWPEEGKAERQSQQLISVYSKRHCFPPVICWKIKPSELGKSACKHVSLPIKSIQGVAPPPLSSFSKSQLNIRLKRSHKRKLNYPTKRVSYEPICFINLNIWKRVV